MVNQTCKDFEILIVNDGSSDNSSQICNYYANTIPNCFVWHQENRGLSLTRSTLIDHAEGEYCVFLDADDCLKPNALEILEKSITLYRSPDCIVFGIERVYKGVTVGVSSDSQISHLSDKILIYKKVLSSESYNSVCRKCTKTNILKLFNIDPYVDIHMGEDLIRSLPIYKESKSVLFIKDILYLYRMNPTSMTHTVKESNFQPSFLLFKLVFEFLQRENISDLDVMLRMRKKKKKKMIRDILTVERFNISRSLKLQIIRNIVSGSKEILHNPISYSELGRRRLIYDNICIGKYSLALFFAKIENYKSRICATLRRFIK